jgi:hypothetical protein
MALIDCVECGKPVSSSVQVCPHCGKKLKMGLLAKAFLWVLGITFALMVIGSINSPTTMTTAIAPHKSPEEIARQERDSKRWSNVVSAGAAIRDSMRNPDSLIWESIRSNDDGSVLCFEYRAQNGFGGMNRAFVSKANGVFSESSAAWNKNCTQPLTDMKYAADTIKTISEKLH